MDLIRWIHQLAAIQAENLLGLRQALMVTVIGAVPFMPVIGQSQSAGGEVDGSTRDYTQATSSVQVSGVVHLRILLVQFADLGCRKDSSGISPRYAAGDFEDLLGSSGVYASPSMRSPDGDELFGSLNDYYLTMSSGAMQVRALVVNRTDPVSGKPLWLTLPNTKQFYLEANMLIFFDAIAAAEENGLDVSTSGDTKLAIIYAGNTYFRIGGLAPRALGNFYLMSEVQGRPYDQENRDARFARIGIHCHEFGHTIGIGHTSGSRADLMESGARNGSAEGNAPSPLNPIARWKKGWITVTDIAGSAVRELELHYSLTEPMVVRITNANGDCFLVENRRFDRTMLIGTTTVPDYNNAAFFPPAGPHGTISQGIFVWRLLAEVNSLDPGYSTEGLLSASGRYGRTFPEDLPSESDDGVPFPGVTGTTLLTPWSDPRNPRAIETDASGSGNRHYMLFVPNTKPGSDCAMEILSEDRDRGCFRVRFTTADPPNGQILSRPPAAALGAYENRRSVYLTNAGLLLRSIEVGGEVFYCADETTSAATTPVLLSDGSGGNSAPSITLAGGSVLAVWHRRAPRGDRDEILWRRSDDTGKTWSQIELLATVVRDESVPPAISLAGSGSGSAIAVYRSGATVRSQVYLGPGWGEPADCPVPPAEYEGATLAIDDTEPGEEYAVIATRATGACRPVRAYRYLFRSSTWELPQCLSAGLPDWYGNETNPNIVRVKEGDGSLSSVIWDANEECSQGRSVIVARQIGRQSMRPVYSMVRGYHQDDVSLVKLPGLITGEGCAGSSRVLHLVDASTGAAASLEIMEMRMLRTGGSVEKIELSEVPPDSVLINARGLMAGGISRPFMIPPEATCIQVVLAAFGENASSLFSPDEDLAGYEMFLSEGDSTVTRLLSLPLKEGRREPVVITIPVSNLAHSLAGRTVCLRPDIRGLRPGAGIAGMIGTVYSVEAEIPADTLLAGVRIASGSADLPTASGLLQNYPNPFNASTVIRYQVGMASHVRLSVVDLVGREVAVLASGVVSPGIHEVHFSGVELASGVYICQMTVGRSVSARKIMLTK